MFKTKRNTSKIPSQEHVIGDVCLIKVAKRCVNLELSMT